MTNLEKIKNKLQKMNAKEMARVIDMIEVDVACKYCIYGSSQCIGDCEFGIEEYLKDEEETESAFDDGYRQAMQDRWIPVSERLPEDSGAYLVQFINDYTDHHWYEVIHFQHKCKKWKRLNHMVIAWRPLPEPYKEVSE